ncbi:wurmchen 1 transmembrane protein [Lasioglossum baleicum]|uniref:wurmchen 1 transmembrane protein n=1 Tax=Lasioglossum baleicum TaxID=434251 RepID=UPI003FCC4EB3
MSILDEREDYLKNPFFVKHEYGDFTPFYVAVAICSFVFVILCILNIGFCFCSRHRDYWQSPFTGNRWIQPLWTVLPHNSPPLDISELEPGRILQPEKQVLQYHNPKLLASPPQSQEYMEMQKRESEI